MGQEEASREGVVRETTTAEGFPTDVVEGEIEPLRMVSSDQVRAY